MSKDQQGPKSNPKLRHLSTAGLAPAVCVGIHAVFAGDGFEALQASAPARIVTCDTIEHPTNEIALAAVLAEAAGELLPEESA